ncbi:MAG: ATP-dependent endonuclease [Candidatus Methylomirabilales bacterium]
MLTHLQVRNYRSLGSVDIPLSSLTAIVGPNGVGKTMILRAIDLVLGEVWPSLRSFRIPQDFMNFDTSREIKITVSFDPPYVHRDTLSNEHEIRAIRVTCKSYKRSGKWGEAGDLHADLEPLNQKGEVPSVAVGQPTKGQKTQFGPLRVGADLREHARVLFVDHRRSLAQHLPSARGSILGRLLQPARKEFTAHDDFKKAYESAMDFLRTEQVRKIEQAVADTGKRMLGFLGSQAAKAVEIGFGFADPANPFNSLRLQYRESGLSVPGEELGLGIQSAMVVGIFEAFRQLGGNFGTIVIEEPEMYLHPQAQRYFYRLLCEMTDKGQCQVIYSTHSPIFADVNRFEALRVVRKEPGKSTSVAYVRQENQGELNKARDAFKLGGRFDPARNEVLFARRALLVEGYGDRVAALLIAEKFGLDVDAEALAVVECGGKAGIELIVGVCRTLDIPFVVLHDEDIWPTDQIADAEKRKKQEEENKAAQEANGRIRKAVGDGSRLFVISPTLEQVLGISRDARDKPRRIAEALQGVDVNNPPKELDPLIDAVKAMNG